MTTPTLPDATATPEIAVRGGGAIMILRPVIDPVTGRTSTVRFHVEGRGAPLTADELTRLLGGSATVVATVPSRHRPGISLVAYGETRGARAPQPPSCVLVFPTGGRMIVLGTLVIAAIDPAGDPALPTPLEILDVEYAKVATLPYPLLRIRTGPLLAGRD